MERFNCSFTEEVEIHKLQPNPKNPNSHPDRQIELLAKIIDYQGQRSPIVVSKRSGFIVKGHGRLDAIKKLGWEKCAVDFQDYESEAQEYADMIADNKIAELAEHDDNLMIEEIKELGIEDFELLGMDDFEIPIEPDEAKEEIEDDIPSSVDTRCKPGDLWILGEHRLLCGDATNIQHVERLMGGEKADITFTSPPYNLGENAALRKDYGSGKKSAYLDRSDHKTQEEYLSFINDFTWICLKNSELSFINIQLLAGNKTALSEYWYGLKDHLVDLMIWNKEHAAPQMAERVLNSVFEFIFIFSLEKNPTRSIKTGRGFHGNIKNIYSLNPVGKKDSLAKNHGAVFPVEFAEYFIENFSLKSVYDPFGGSGSTLIACEKTKRKCFMMEIDPHYCDVILSRWENYSGKEAKLDATEERNSA